MAMTMTGNLSLFKRGIFHLKINLSVKKIVFNGNTNLNDLPHQIVPIKVCEKGN